MCMDTTMMMMILNENNEKNSRSLTHNHRDRCVNRGICAVTAIACRDIHICVYIFSLCRFLLFFFFRFIRGICEFVNRDQNIKKNMNEFSDAKAVFCAHTHISAWVGTVFCWIDVCFHLRSPIFRLNFSYYFVFVWLWIKPNQTESNPVRMRVNKELIKGMFHMRIWIFFFVKKGFQV